MAWVLLLALYVLLVMDFLTLRDELPFRQIGETLLLGFFVAPFTSALRLAPSEDEPPTNELDHGR